jgi:hypothetical protein
VDVIGRMIEIHGPAAQRWKAAEEMGELIRALARQDADNIAEEIADVEIMLEELKAIYHNGDRVAKWRQRKLERMETMVREVDKRL